MISVNDFKTGLTIELEGDVWVVLEFLHVKPGKGSAFVRSRLRNLRTGAVQERTFRAGEKVPRARVERSRMQYLYTTGDEYWFMDTETFEQVSLTGAQIGDGRLYLKPEMVIDVLQWEGRLIGVELPNTVELAVTEAEPGVRGDTASGGTKPATLETGAVVQVPLFIEVGNVLRIDTRTGHYIERA